MQSRIHYGIDGVNVTTQYCGERAASLNCTPGENDTLTIDAVIAGGDGIARRGDGRVVFVSRAAPGERVEVTYVETRAQWLRGRIVRVVEASPDRRDAPCPHYARCGGCQLQHLDYAKQRAIKGEIVAEAFRRLGGIEIEPPEVVASPAEFNYRNRVTFMLRTDTVAAGFHALGEPGAVIDVDRCPLAEEAINEAWFGLRASWGALAERMPPGPELRLTFRANADGEVGLAIEGADDPGSLQWMPSEVSRLVAVWALGKRGEVTMRAGQGFLFERWHGLDVPLEGTAFVQVNRQVATVMESHVRDVCGDVDGRRVVDGYCGYGLRTIAMANAGADVVGIDLDRGAIASAKQLAKQSGASARFLVAGVERAIGRELPADLVVLNPPRRGLDKRVCKALVKKPPGRIVYVSCDPPTLARDLKLLSSTFDISSTRAFDLFPQTSHVETVVVLDRWSGGI